MGKIKTRDKLLDAGYEEIYKYGFQGASIDSILQSCNVPKGSMYHHFKSKKALALAVIDERLSPKMLAMLGEVKADDILINKIFSIIDFIGSIPYLLQFGCPLSKLITEMSPLDKDFELSLSSLHKQIHTHVKLMIDKGIDNEEIISLDSSSLATFIVASVWGNISIGKDLVTEKSYQNSILHLKNYLISLQNS